MTAYLGLMASRRALLEEVQGTVVAYLINIRAEIQASAQHVSFRICLGITGEDETGVSIGDLEGDGPVVQVIAIIGDGTQDCEGSIAQRVGLVPLPEP